MNKPMRKIGVAVATAGVALTLGASTGSADPGPPDRPQVDFFDIALAEDVLNRDDELDALKTQIFRELLTYMLEDPRNIYRAIRAQSIAKYLERIGDHATNLAEMVVFMAIGKDIRHLRSRTP